MRSTICLAQTHVRGGHTKPSQDADARKNGHQCFNNRQLKKGILYRTKIATAATATTSGQTHIDVSLMK
jgi:hypothetical protein